MTINIIHFYLHKFQFLIIYKNSCETKRSNYYAANVTFDTMIAVNNANGKAEK